MDSRSIRVTHAGRQHMMRCTHRWDVRMPSVVRYWRLLLGLLLHVHLDQGCGCARRHRYCTHPNRVPPCHKQQVSVELVAYFERVSHSITRCVPWHGAEMLGFRCHMHGTTFPANRLITFSFHSMGSLTYRVSHWTRRWTDRGCAPALHLISASGRVLRATRQISAALRSQPARDTTTDVQGELC